MNLNFAEALQRLGPNVPFTIVNEARPTAEYIFAQLLPERPSFDYIAQSGNMRIATTMAGLVGMDSPYPPGGLIEGSDFFEKVPKIANDVPLSEQALRQMQQLLMMLQVNQQPTIQVVEDNALNFLRKVVLQAHMDTMEWLRGQALVNAAINWRFNNKTLAVNYGRNAANTLAMRTVAGGTAYHLPGSTFWADLRSARSLLRMWGVQIVIAHPDTIDAIVTNDANSLTLLAQPNGGGAEIVRVIGPNRIPSSDIRERLTLVSYDREGEFLDPNNSGATIRVPFMPRGTLLFVARNVQPGFQVGVGSTPDPNNNLELGYTHLAPTVEGGGQPGRWSRLYTPDDKPWQLRGQGVTNGMPVIEAPNKTVILRTEMP